MREIGYIFEDLPFHADRLDVTDLLRVQSENIDRGVSRSEQGAGDQGLMFGFACNETPERLPLPIVLAHRLARTLAADRHAGRIPWARPDAKTQVTVRYEEGRPVEVDAVVVSTQHAPTATQTSIRDSMKG